MAVLAGFMLYNGESGGPVRTPGAGGVTPPGGDQGAAGSTVAGFQPDLRKSETRLNFALLIKL